MKSDNQPAIQEKVILHADMDAFYAAIEERDHPEYQGKPIIIGADPRSGSGRGVVSTANYEARKYGVHSAMAISQAYRRCPNAIFLPPDMRRYVQESKKIMEIFFRYSPLVEPLSIDEAFMDCTGNLSLFGSYEAMGLRLKKEVYEERKLRVSVGIASNKFIAKVASDYSKPDGFLYIPAGKEREFLDPLPVERLWGAGKKSAPRLRAMGLATIGDVYRCSPVRLEREFGKMGEHFHLLAGGVDERSVEPMMGRKSISEERTFPVDTDDENLLQETLYALIVDVAENMRREKITGRTISLKIRLEGFETYTRSITLKKLTDETSRIREAVNTLYDRFDRKGKKVRLIGMGVSNLSAKSDSDAPGEQFSLFTDPEESRDSHGEKIDIVMDELRTKFGNHVVRGSLMDHGGRFGREMD